jgi:hypothetical protein
VPSQLLIYFESFASTGDTFEEHTSHLNFLHSVKQHFSNYVYVKKLSIYEKVTKKY